MKRIIILTAGFGDGHNTAAAGLKEALTPLTGVAQVEVVDILEQAYGRANALARHTHYRVVQYAPVIWGGLYHTLDRSAQWTLKGTWLSRASERLAELFKRTKPECVLATYPVYGALVRSLYPEPVERPFRFGLVITDSLTVNSAWTVAGADFFCVPNDETAEVLSERGVERRRILVSGFPVSPRFVELSGSTFDWETGQAFRVLYVLNHGTRKAMKTVRRLLEIPGVRLTVVAGRNWRIESKLRALAPTHPDGRLAVLGWTTRMPELMLQSHLVITKAGGATLQEALAAGKPVIVSQVVPGQEVGNAQLVEESGLGAVARRPKDVARWTRQARKRRGWMYRRWRQNVERHRRPGAAEMIARFVLAGSNETRRSVAVCRARQRRIGVIAARRGPGRGIDTLPGMLGDFHVHSRYSGGRLSIAELVDLYGRHRFGVLCITDTVANPESFLGRRSIRRGLAMDPEDLAGYFECLEREGLRAWKRYGMILLPGLEIDGRPLGLQSPTRLLAVGLRKPLETGESLAATVELVRAQGALVVGSWCHESRGWTRAQLVPDRDEPPFDAWEIGGRRSLVPGPGWERLPCIAGSNFHMPEDIRSWKTVLYCERGCSAVLEMIRQRRHLGLVYYNGAGPENVGPVPRRFRKPERRLSECCARNGTAVASL
jgi:UDP-N-acetylglucosamine:LPS N-acetylglucosamine transferase